MKLNSLLLGSACALFAITTAQGADPVLAEPEPMDYVKVCDMYGAGFFYIPGTETCLKISGYVDVQYEYTNFDADALWTSTDDINNQNPETVGTDPQPFDGSFSVGEPVYLARVNFDAREETDWGTLRAYIRLEGEGTNEGGASVTAKDVFIELGGLSTGYRTTALETGGLPGLMLDGYYGGGRHMYMNYTWAANGFAVTAGADLDDGSSLSTVAINGIDDAYGPDMDALLLPILVGWSGSTYGSPGGDGESVNPYIVASYTGSMFSLRGKYGHDSSASEQHYGVDGSVTPWAGFTIRGYWEGNSGVNEYAFSADYLGYWPDGLDWCGCINEGPDVVLDDPSYNLYAEHNWGIGATYQILPNLSVAAGYSAASFEKPAAGSHIDDLESYVIGLDWNPVDNLVVRLNYRHQDWGVEESSVEADEFRVRIRRTF